MKHTLFLLTLLALTSCGTDTKSEKLHVAVASNFYASAERLAEQFTTQTGIEVKLSAGSTGQLYTQISQGAPFDIFLAADVARPLLLEEQELIVPDSRFTYVEGRLALWSLLPFDTESVESINTIEFDHLAIANPKLAPYGLAAEQAMKNLNVYDEWQGRLVLGQNVAQAQQFVVAGQAQYALISWSQALLWKEKYNSGHFILLPENSHEPIAQQAIQIKEGKNAASFIGFLKSEVVKKQLESWGYEVSSTETNDVEHGGKS